MEIKQFIGNADEFPILRNWNFLNHAAVAPIPRSAAAAVARYAAHASEHAYIDSGWYKQIDLLRAIVAKLIAAEPAEIAFVKNTSEGLAIVAAGLDWKQGDRIVTTAVEYPANAYPWIDLAQRKGIDLLRIDETVDADGTRQVPIDAILKAAEHTRTRLITLSHVEFGSGQRHDLAAIGRFCRERGILLCVDAIQSLGVIPIDVRAMNIDFLSADGHKWMLAPEGAGVFYCRRELIEQVHPPLIGWLNVRDPLNFDRIDYVLKADAGRFECGSHNVPGLMGMKASLELISSIGVEAIWQQVRSLTNHLVDSLSARGYQVVSPRREQQRSGIVSFTRDDINLASTVKRLHEQHIEITLRAGRLRCSPHFYNTSENIEHLVANLPR